MGFALFNALTSSMGLGRPDLNFDTLMFEPVAKWLERAPGGAPWRALEKRLVAN
ncbi:hypothetical protein C8D77_10287 [Mesorhizobium loti]|uniref:Uncharacterized protein n=1 Tax=Rhizobium loti TaxID=381 RepID=A0A8E3B5U6_RHILI|nr:hypothetical protein C8D77_10287 [Mesorhizobium loti]